MIFNELLYHKVFGLEVGIGCVNLLLQPHFQFNCHVKLGLCPKASKLGFLCNFIGAVLERLD